MSELFFMNDQVQEWGIFRDVQPLFASAIPWQIPNTKVPAEERCIEGFRVFFPQDMSNVLHMCPERGLKEKQFNLVLHPLSLLLRSLDCLVLDAVLDKAEGLAENIDSISREQTTNIFKWLTSTSDMPGRAGPTYLTSREADCGSHLEHVAQLHSGQDRAPAQFTKLKALGNILNHQLHQQERHDGLSVFLQLTNDVNTYGDILQKLKILIESMQRFQRKVNLLHSGHSGHTTMPSTQWDNLAIGRLSSALYASFSRILRPGGGCPGHKAYIRLNGFDLEEEPTFFDVFLSICPSTTDWRAGRCISIDRKTPQKGTIPDEMCQIIRVPNWRRMGLHPLHLHFDQDFLWDATEFVKDLQVQAAQPTVTLKALIDSGVLQRDNEFTRNDRAILALSLAKCMLHLFKGPWMQHTWDSAALHFPESFDKNFVLDIHSPYVRCSFDQTRQSDTQRLNIAATYSVVRSFAKVLLELWQGEPVTIAEYGFSDPDDDIKESLYEAYRTLLKSHANEQWVSVSFRRAMESCLQFDTKLRMASGSKCSIDVDSNLVRKYLYTDIIEHLEKNLSHLDNYEKAIRPCDIRRYGRTAEIPSSTYLETLQGGIPTKEENAYQVQGRVTRPPIVEHNEFVTLMNDREQSASEVDNREKGFAESFLRKLKDFNKEHVPGKGPRNLERSMIKICVIDTGLNKSDPLIKPHWDDRVLQKKSWVDTEPDNVHDECGHGTHISRLILANTTSAGLLVAKVTKDKLFRESSLKHIVEAIEWATAQGAHIISLSLGFHDKKTDLEIALENAITPKDKDPKTMPTLVFAAAGNWGLNRNPAFPAQQSGVFCIYASDGNGYRDKINPPNKGNYSFTTLGVAIPSRWNEQDTFVTGTSYATPIAATIAAVILEFARREMDLNNYHWQKLTSCEGMQKVFDLLSAPDLDYKYVCLERFHADGHRTKDQIKQAIEHALCHPRD